MATDRLAHRSTKGNPLYRAWHNMKSRCDNPNVPCYKNYGGRGINYDQKWSSFLGFYEDMHLTYKDGLTLDRIDNNDGYKKSNCRWIEASKQQNNKRTNHYISYGKFRMTVSDWARFLNIPSSTFRQRLYAYKWPLDKLIGGYLGNR